MPSHVIRTESRTFPYNVKYHMEILLYIIAYSTWETLIQFSQLYTLAQWLLCYRLVHFLHQISRFISVTFKTNIGTWANTLQVLQCNAVSFETLPPVPAEIRSSSCSRPNAWKAFYWAVPSRAGDELLLVLVPLCGTLLLMCKSGSLCMQIYFCLVYLWNRWGIKWRKIYQGRAAVTTAENCNSLSFAILI